MSNNKVSEKPRMDLQDIDVLRNEARVSPVAGFGSVLETPQIDVRDKITDDLLNTIAIGVTVDDTTENRTAVENWSPYS